MTYSLKGVFLYVLARMCVVCGLSIPKEIFVTATCFYLPYNQNYNKIHECDWLSAAQF